MWRAWKFMWFQWKLKLKMWSNNVGRGNYVIFMRRRNELQNQKHFPSDPIFIPYNTYNSCENNVYICIKQIFLKLHRNLQLSAEISFIGMFFSRVTSICVLYKDSLWGGLEPAKKIGWQLTRRWYWHLKRDSISVVSAEIRLVQHS